MSVIEHFVSLLKYDVEDDWRKSLVQMGSTLGFEQTLIALAPNRPTSISEAFLHSNYANSWLDVYSRQQLVAVDPTVTHCLSRSTPLIWEPSIFCSQKQKEMYEEAAGYGLRSGVTLPFHGVNGEIGILCLVNNLIPNESLCREMLHSIPVLSMMRDFAFEASLRFAKLSTPPPPSLTPRELECLKWCAAGKSSWEIATILSCSEAVVNFHFGNLRRKFRASSRRQVVVKAIHCGLIRSY